MEPIFLPEGTYIDRNDLKGMRQVTPEENYMPHFGSTYKTEPIDTYLLEVHGKKVQTPACLSTHEQADWCRAVLNGEIFE